MSNDAEASNLDGLLDYSGSLGRFVVLNPSGQLFALNQVLLSRDYRKVVPRLCNADFEPARSLVLGLKPSNITLVLHGNISLPLPATSNNKTESITVFLVGEIQTATAEDLI